MNYLIKLNMIKEVGYISFLFGVSYFHTIFVFPVIISYISINTYNCVLSYSY